MNMLMLFIISLSFYCVTFITNCNKV